MSYTELDAWLDEKARGDWPFDRWDIGSLPLRDTHGYFDYPSGMSGIGVLHYRLLRAFGEKSEDRLRRCLDAAVETVRVAIEQSDMDARYSWVHHEVWLSLLDDSLNGSDQPADMLTESIEYFGVADSFSEQEVLAALGLWLVGEWIHLRAIDDPVQAMVQIGIAVAEAEFYRGIETGRKLEADKVASRSRKANDARHAANRIRLQQAEEWWKENGKNRLTAAESTRQLASKFNVVEDVARRWTRQFQRKNEGR